MSPGAALFEGQPCCFGRAPIQQFGGRSCIRTSLGLRTTRDVAMHNVALDGNRFLEQRPCFRQQGKLRHDRPRASLGHRQPYIRTSTPNPQPRHVSCGSGGSAAGLTSPGSRPQRRGIRPAIEMEGVGLSLGKAQVLKGCSLKVPRGELWMLLGPNGCGKSTLLKVLAGLLRPDTGRADVQHPRSFVFQNPDHQVVMPTVNADVAFGLGTRRECLSDPEVEERVNSALDAVGMLEYANRSVQTLSGGQKQRVAIAGALAQQAHVLLLDELTTFLDSSDQMGVVRAVRHVVGGPREVAALWVTHRLEELQYADGAVYMEAGQVVMAGNPKKVEAHILRLREAQRLQKLQRQQPFV